MLKIKSIQKISGTNYWLGLAKAAIDTIFISTKLGIRYYKAALLAQGDQYSNPALHHNHAI